MREIKQNATANVMVFMADSTDHITGKTGLTLAVTVSKDGAGFASITPTVTERGNGWYNVALATGDTGTVGDLVVRSTATGADPGERTLNVVANVEADSYAIVNHASYGNAQLVRSTTPANTFDVSATGEAGLDFANIKQATGATTLTNITVPTVTTLTGHTPQTGDTYALANGANGFANIKSDSGTLLTRVPSEVAQKSHLVNGTGNITPPTNVGLWDRVDAAVTTRASATDYTTARAAKIDNLDATVSSRLAGASYTAPDNTNIGLIKAKTDNLPADPASNTQVNTRLATSGYTAPDNTTIGFIQKWILNKLVEGPANTWKLYDDDSATVLKTWTWDPNTTTRSKAV
ncbi:MAG: hypothetical protein HZB84_10600 [Deltaproteobacteria bacterium]|nr:hypothetical protein [Deltaproteobacteria bacterium]